MIDQNIIVLIFIIFGCVLRTLLPYARKVSNGTVTKFDMKFMGTLAIAIFVGIIAGIIVFPTFIIPEGNTLTVIMMAVLWGWGLQSVINNLLPS